MIIYKDFVFDMAHRLDNYKGLCRSIHGHLYTLSVGININKLDSLGMCVDFKVLKAVVTENVINYMDHSLWLNDSKENKKLIKAVKSDNMRLILTPYNPTAEMMALNIWSMLNKSLPLFTITLYETPTSKVTINSDNYEKMKHMIKEIDFSGEAV